MIEPGIDVILFACAAIFIGELMGAIVGGGSFITQPALIALGIPPQMAVAHDISACIGTTGAIYHYFERKKMIRKEYLFWFLPGTIIGALIGVNILVSVSPDIIEKTIGITALVWVFVILFLKPDSGIVKKEPIAYWKPVAVISGFAFGIYTGFSGAGSGIMLTIIFVQLFGMTFLEKKGMNAILHIVGMVMALAAYIYHRLIYWPLLLPMMASAAAAGYLGSHISFKMGDRKLKLVFSVFLIGIAIWLLTK